MFVKKICPNCSSWLIVLLFAHVTILHGQEREWEFDKSQREAEQAKIERDSVITHLRKKWEIGLNYNRWTFSNAVRLPNEEFQIDRSLNLWRIEGRWHFKERFFASFSIGFQLKADQPDQSEIFAQVFSGDSIQIEGSGVTFVPIKFGVHYYLKPGRFRPFIGVGMGSTNAISRYIRAEGETIGDIENETLETEAQSRFADFNLGFDYRLGGDAHLTFTHSRYVASNFANPVAGYERYGGSTTGIGISIIL